MEKGLGSINKLLMSVVGQARPNLETKKNPITEDYQISTNVLGLGINGKVVEVTNKQDGHKYALKVLKDNSKSRREVELHWKSSNCIHVVNIKDVYENTHKGQKCLLVVMEWWVWHSAEISGFCCHSDFPWNQFVGFSGPKTLSPEITKMAFFERQDLPKLISRKISVAVKSWIFHTVYVWETSHCENVVFLKLFYVKILWFIFSMEGGELFSRIQEKQAFNERGT